MIPTVTRNCPRFVAYFLDVTSNQGQVGDAMMLRLSSHFYMNLLVWNHVSILLITV